MDIADAWEQARQAWRRLATNSGRPRDDDDGLDALSDVGVVRRMLDQAELAAVRAARVHGKSWAEIATHLGVTRQSAWERWRDLDDSPGAESTVLADAASHLVKTRAQEQRRASKVRVPNVVAPGSSPTKARSPGRWSAPDRWSDYGYAVTVTPESVNHDVRDLRPDRLARCCPNRTTRPSASAPIR